MAPLKPYRMLLLNQRGDLEIAQAILLREIIENVTQPGTPAVIQLKALKYLDKLAETLQVKLGVETVRNSV